MDDEGSVRSRPDHEVVVIGAGAGGICAGIKLQEMGIDDFLLVDRAPAMGGTWRANTYPNVGADLPFLAYQFSFAPKADWSRFFAKGAEIQAYHVGLALEAGLDRKVRLNTTIVREEWDEGCHLWRLHLEDGGQLTARFVISAVGAYINPKDKPDIPGLDDFEGKVMIPAAWDDDYDYSGLRTAIIGVGSSAVQIAPALAERAAHLDVYQRTPQWYFPKPDFKNPGWLKTLLRVPRLAGLLHGVALAFIDLGLRVLIYTPRQLFGFGARRFDSGAHVLYDLWLWICVRDRETRRKLRPSYGAGCTRGTLGGGYLSIFNRPNVELHTSSIARIEPDAIVTADGERHPIDLLVLATGYEMFSDPESYREGAVVGANGFDLGAYYNSVGLEAYHSTAVAGLPNRWLMVGPYSWTGTAFHYILENAIRHITTTLGEAGARAATRVEVRPEAQAEFHSEMKTKGENLHTYFNVHCAGSNTYFVNSQKQAVYVRPWTLLQSFRRSTGFRRDDYLYEAMRSADTRSGVSQLDGVS